MATGTELKRGSLGDICLESVDGVPCVVRDLRSARWRWLAGALARREAKALQRLAGTRGVPELIRLERERLIRSFLPGSAMHLGPRPSAVWFRDALRLVRSLHRLGITHNDLAKEANWILVDDRTAGVVDFQLATRFLRRGRLFRTLAHEDLRHLLKHKRHYRPDALTARQRRILANPLWPARLWRRLVKPVYLFTTRRILGWPERDGAAERQRPR